MEVLPQSYVHATNWVLELTLSSIRTVLQQIPRDTVLGFVESSIAEGIAQITGSVSVHAAQAIGTEAVFPVLADL